MGGGGLFWWFFHTRPYFSNFPIGSIITGALSILIAYFIYFLLPQHKREIDFSTIKLSLDEPSKFNDIFFRKILRESNIKKPICIIIDNLDRVSPERAIEIISQIKTFVIEPIGEDIPSDKINFCFLVTCDDKELSSHLNRSSIKVKNPEEFLRKFFTITFRLPEFRAKDLFIFTKNLIKEAMPYLEEDQVMRLSSVINEALKDSPRQPKVFINRLIAKLEYFREVRKEDFYPEILKHPEWVAFYMILEEEFGLSIPSLLSNIEKSVQEQFGEDKEDKKKKERILRFIKNVEHLAKPPNQEVWDNLMFIKSDNLRREYPGFDTALSFYKEGNIGEAMKIAERHRERISSFHLELFRYYSDPLQKMKILTSIFKVNKQLNIISFEDTFKKELNKFILDISSVYLLDEELDVADLYKLLLPSSKIEVFNRVKEGEKHPKVTEKDLWVKESGSRFALSFLEEFIKDSDSRISTHKKGISSVIEKYASKEIKYSQLAIKYKEYFSPKILELLITPDVFYQEKTLLEVSISDLFFCVRYFVNKNINLDSINLITNFVSFIDKYLNLRVEKFQKVFDNTTEETILDFLEYLTEIQKGLDNIQPNSTINILSNLCTVLIPVSFEKGSPIDQLFLTYVLEEMDIFRNIKSIPINFTIKSTSYRSVTPFTIDNNTQGVTLLNKCKVNDLIDFMRRYPYIVKQYPSYFVDCNHISNKEYVASLFSIIPSSIGYFIDKHWSNNTLMSYLKEWLKDNVYLLTPKDKNTILNTVFKITGQPQLINQDLTKIYEIISLLHITQEENLASKVQEHFNKMIDMMKCEDDVHSFEKLLDYVLCAQISIEGELKEKIERLVSKYDKDTYPSRKNILSKSKECFRIKLSHKPLRKIGKKVLYFSKYRFSFINKDWKVVTERWKMRNENLFEYNVALLILNGMNVGLDEFLQNNIVEFVKKGGKLLAVHDTMYKGYNRILAEELCGVAGGFSKDTKIKVYKCKDQKIITDLEEFEIRDEIITKVDFPFDSNEVEIILEGKLEDNTTVPVGWIRKYHRGKLFCFTLGHSKEILENKDIKKILLVAIDWLKNN